MPESLTKARYPKTLIVWLILAAYASIDIFLICPLCPYRGGSSVNIWFNGYRASVRRPNCVVKMDEDWRGVELIIDPTPEQEQGCAKVYGTLPLPAPKRSGWWTPWCTEWRHPKFSEPVGVPLNERETIIVQQYYDYLRSDPEWSQRCRPEFFANFWNSGDSTEVISRPWFLHDVVLTAVVFGCTVCSIVLVWRGLNLLLLGTLYRFIGRHSVVGTCPRCHYNLKGLPPQARCPECGHASERK